ncbi:putative late blight resistance protein homolog R1B-17 [Andrographis paniculata]|uniref:putative late blight resistance protein homolog R1B-17 n=1 Tax=Andrographis paniculata TaxID=175694 RepID=UPI0021E8EF0A|nr:putative late blight resistance protein homolog R1B-17 [Andrographis paniculata]
MAVAAYASLVSLTHVLDNLHYRARFNLPRADIKQVEELRENVNSLLQFVERHSARKSSELRRLWRQMTEAAAEAEGSINFHVVHLLHVRSQGETSDASNFSAFCEEMKTLIKKFCSIEDKLPVIDGGEDNQAQKQSNSVVPSGGSSSASSYVSDLVVGLDEHVNEIREKLVEGRSDFKILPIVGMGGIGKTTLAKIVFQDKFIVEHFDLRIWLPISQQYSAKQILKVGLGEKAGENKIFESLDELGTRFYQKLFGRRYLIVMDDMWSTGAWDDLRRYFPNAGDGSRILLTTRLSDMAAALGSYDPHRLTFLDENESWRLFCQSAFSQKGCPYGHLEKFAKDITRSCRGLPLEIVVVGRLLANSDTTAKYWNNIWRNISSFVDLGDDDHCMNILSLSYESLPIELKVCFLYMRVFPEDGMIFVSELIDLWIAEGFIKPVSGRRLEDIASEYVSSLIGRNLIFSKDEDQCGIHDLLRDLCFRESNEECFLQFPRVQRVNQLKGIFCNHCCKKVKDSEGLHVLKPSYIFGSPSLDNPRLCDACNKVYSHITRHSLVRMAIYKDQEILQPTELRLLDLDVQELLSPSTIYLLWNLQSLDIELNSSSPTSFPAEIWEMPQLREIRSQNQMLLPNPTDTDINGVEVLILNDLHTIHLACNVKFTKEIIDRIPNLKNLKVAYHHFENEEDMEDLNFCLCNLEQLKKLESLSIRFSSESMTFPKSLKELSLTNCKMTWEDMSIVGSLPSLEKLEINGQIQGDDWKPGVGEFPCLKKLQIHYTRLRRWEVGAENFPKLEHLLLKGLYSLEEIPLSVGDIPTLKSIVLNYCSESAADSAKKLWEDQYEFGNDIRIDLFNIDRVSYTVGTSTASMTATGCKSLATFKHLQQRLEEVSELGRNSIDEKQLEVLKEDIDFLQYFVKVFHPSKSQEIENLSSEIAQAIHKAVVVIQRLHLETLTPIFGKIIFEDVGRLLAIIDFMKRELSVAEAEGKEDKYESLQIDVTDNDVTLSYDIKSLRIIYLDMTVIDGDLREYRINSVTATMAEAASLLWSELACIVELFRKAYELSRRHLNVKKMEEVEESISFLQDVVEVHPERKIQEIESLSCRFGHGFDVPRLRDFELTWLRSLDNIADEDIKSLLRDVERMTKKICSMKDALLAPKGEDNSTDDEEDDYC